jgi:hypothetical protein
VPTQCCQPNSCGCGSSIFVHVTKCGGTSILNSIREAFPVPLGIELNGDRFSDKNSILAQIADRLPTAKIVYGHRVFAGLRPIMRQPVQMVTVLRNPIDRAISQYNYILTRPRERQIVHRALTQNNVRVPFAAWLEEFPPASNHLIWMLAQVLGDQPRVFDFSERAGVDDFRLVSRRLHMFSNVFFVENGGVDTAIRELTGLGPRRENVNAQRSIDPADPETRAAAAAASALDIAIYEQALRQFPVPDRGQEMNEAPEK